MKRQKILSVFVSLVIVFGLAGHALAQGTFTLEQVLSPPYPWSLVSAKNADRIA